MAGKAEMTVRFALLREDGVREIVRSTVCDVLGAIEARERRHEEAVANWRRFRRWAKDAGLIGWRRWLPRFMR